jgi:arylsulfatase A-like enzyme
MYDGEVAYVDAELGRLLDRLRAMGLYDDALIVVTSDHGEFFGEHGLWGHGWGPYEAVYRVPLLVKYPRSRSVGVDDRLLSTVGVFATILEAVNIERLEPSNSGSDSKLPEVIFEQEPHPWFEHHYGERFARSYVGVYRDRWKYVRYADGEELLFDLSQDPGEAMNLAESPIKRGLEETLARWLEETVVFDNEGMPANEKIDPEAIERLRALGYIR